MTTAVEPLWVCHRCEMIGTGMEAGRHVDQTGHPVEMLSDKDSDGIRDIWEQEGRAFHRRPSAVEFVVYARFMGLGR